MKPSIQTEIEKLQQTKEGNRIAIMEKGVTVYGNDLYSSYPTRISQITMTPGDKDDIIGALIDRSVTSFEIPYGATLIGFYAFNGCSSLTSITIPDSVTSIGGGAFRGCTSLTNVTIPDSVTIIGNYAFQSCSSLTSINIPDSVTSIGYGAFRGCSSLASITVNATTPPTLSGGEFYNTNDCPIYVPENSVEAYKAAWTKYADRIQAIPVHTALKWTSADGTQEISLACEDLAEAGTLAEDDRRIADADYLMDSVEGSAEIGDCVTTIGYGAFQYCTRLTSINIPSGVTSIEMSAFENCTSLTSITIPNSVTTIGDIAFNNCSKLTSVNIPDSVTTIGNSAFFGCTALTSVTIGSGVTTIGNSAFFGCTALTSVTIGSGVTTIGSSAFFGCTALTSVTIGSGVTTIGYEAFRNCSSLTSVTCLATTPPTLGSDVFYGSSCQIYVPAGTLSTYRSASGWNSYADRIFEYGVAKWTEQSFECEVDETGTKTGMVTVVEKDTNPTSSTYNQTRSRTYEDERCSSTQSFIKITSLDDATSGKYLIVNTSVNKALNASLIKDSTNTSGINAGNNMIDVTIEDDKIAQDDNTLNAAADYDAENKTLSWTDSDTGTTYYLYWQGGSTARFAYNGITQPSAQYPMEAKYYENFGSFSFANSAKLLAYNTKGPRFYFYSPNSNNRYEANMALFKLNQ